MEKKNIKIEILKVKDWKSEEWCRKHGFKIIPESMRKRPTVCPKTGNINLEYNPKLMDKDFFISVKNSSGEKLFSY